MRYRARGARRVALCAFVVVLLSSCNGQFAPLASGSRVTLLNVSYDPTRELYVEFNAALARYWKA